MKGETDIGGLVRSIELLKTDVEEGLKSAVEASKEAARSSKLAAANSEATNQSVVVLQGRVAAVEARVTSIERTRDVRAESAKLTEELKAVRQTSSPDLSDEMRESLLRAEKLAMDSAEADGRFAVELAELQRFRKSAEVELNKRRRDRQSSALKGTLSAVGGVIAALGTVVVGVIVALRQPVPAPGSPVPQAYAYPAPPTFTHTLPDGGVHTP